MEIHQFESFLLKNERMVTKIDLELKKLDCQERDKEK